MTTLKIISAGAVKRGVSRVAQAFERETGTRVTVEFNTAPEIRQRLAAGDAADVFVAPPAVIDELERQGKLLAGTRGFVGRSRMGVVVHASAAAPDLRNAGDFKKALLAADGVVINRASSGIYAAKLLEKLGLTAALGAKIAVVDSGSAVMEHVAVHPAAVGLAQISEVMVLIDKGCPVKLAAPLPDEIQNVTSYDAAAMAGAPPAAADLAGHLTSDAARKVFAATGIS